MIEQRRRAMEEHTKKQSSNKCNDKSNKRKERSLKRRIWVEYSSFNSSEERLGSLLRARKQFEIRHEVGVAHVLGELS